MDKQKKDIMKYSKDYMSDNNGIIEMSRTKYQEENEIQYITFTLGYDLINEMLTKPDTADPLECDTAYDFCDYLARKFIKTDYYEDNNHSTYEMLQDWISDNIEIIQSEYLCYSEKDNKCIIETGKRNNDKVALVEQQFKDGTKEYIIAFHYELGYKKLDWGYGYYYGNDLKKAREDFEKVKAGAYLADTFKDEKNKSLEMPKNMEKFNEIKKEMEKILENDEEYSDYKIECMLIDKNNIGKSYGIAMCDNDVAIVDISKKEINDISNAEYTFDIGEDSIFPSLETGTMEIAYMSIEVHSYIWEEINRYYPEDIENRKGMQKYLKYCKENNITKEVIDKLTNCNEISDVMKYYQERKIKNREAR